MRFWKGFQLEFVCGVGGRKRADIVEQCAASRAGDVVVRSVWEEHLEEMQWMGLGLQKPRLAGDPRTGAAGCRNGTEDCGPGTERGHPRSFHAH